MSRINDLLIAAIKAAGDKPPDTVAAPVKKAYSERLSNTIALALAEELRHRGMKGARPVGPGELGLSGAERRLAGGIGAKKVDVTWATEESGLLFAASVKTIMFRDGTTKNFQKNLTNRRGDILFESVTLHRRFPYSVLSAFLLLDHQAEHDGTALRNSTFVNAFPRLRLFTRRADPAGRDEQFERFFLLLADVNQFQPSIRAFEVNDSETEIDLSSAIDEMLELLVERNFDHYETSNGNIRLT